MQPYFYELFWFCSCSFFSSRSYLSAPMHCLAAGHHSMHEGIISRVIVFPHPLQIMSGSSVHISFLWVQKAQIKSSGYGLLISLLPGQLSFII